MLGISLSLAIVDDLHRVLALEIKLGPTRLRVDRIDAEIGRDVAIEQVELEVDEDRLLVRDLEPEPVEAGFPFFLVFEVIDVVGRAVNVAAKTQLVGLRHESLGSASIAARSVSSSRRCVHSKRID